MKEWIRTIVISAGLWAACSIPAFSQMAIGPKFSGHLSSTQAQDMEALGVPGARFGWQAGFMVQKHLNDKWAFQPELTYARKGFEAFEQTAFSNTFIFDGDVVLDYLELDLHAKYFLSSKADTDWYLIGGLYAAYNVRTRFKGEQGLPGLTSPFEFNLIDEPLENINLGVGNRFDMGVNVGLGAQFDLGLPWFFAEIRYSQGLLNLDSENEGSVRNYYIGGIFGWIVYLQGDK